MYNVFVASVFYTGIFSVNEWSIRYGIVFAVHFFLALTLLCFYLDLGQQYILHYISVNMLRMCSFTYHRSNLLTNRNGDRHTFVGIRMHFRDRSRGFAILEICSLNL